MDNKSEREGLMQRIDLAAASACSGGKDLLTPKQAQQWVAEFAEDLEVNTLERSYPQEAGHYQWENQPYYHKTRQGKLIKQQNVDDPSNCLCLVLNDDIGVMLDLAQHQSDVVNNLDEWAKSGSKEGSTERDYVLGTIIESMTVVDKTAVLSSLERLPDSDSKAMVADLDKLDKDKKAETTQALLDWLNEDSNDGARVGTIARDHPAALKAKLAAIREEATRTNYYEIADRLNWTTEDHYTRAALASADQRFVDKHIKTIKALKEKHNESLRAVLQGASIGEQGINELIDRPRMEAFMVDQRQKLARWQSQLEKITEDRVTLICGNRFQRAAWYFDPNDEAQIEASFTLEYLCIKDVCRTDYAAEKVASWMEEWPQYTRPMFYALPLVDQAQKKEPMATYANISGAGYGLALKAKDYSQSIINAEAGRLPAIKAMSENIQLKSAAIGDALSPAISMRIAQTMEQLHKGIESERIPPLDEIFRDLPFFLKGKMLDAVAKGAVEFRVSSSEELETFKSNLHKVMQLNSQLSDISKEHERVKATEGHRSERATLLVEDFHTVRENQRLVSEHLVAALSPIEESDVGLKLSPSEAGRAGLAVILPAAEKQQVGRVMQQLRKGVAAIPNANIVGDGIGVGIFFVQLTSLVGALNEYFMGKDAFGASKSSYLPVLEAAFSTSAAGFACAQGIGDSALGVRANQLARTWQMAELKNVDIQMGKLHAWFGGIAYATAFVSSAFALNKHRNNWLEAVKSGNHQAEIAAVTAMVGSGGLMATNATGVGYSLRAMAQVISAGRAAALTSGAEITGARAAVWASAGPRLASLFGRLNLLGLILTGVELGGTWFYNYSNRSQRDEWLTSTPWTSDAGENKELTLDDYIEELERTYDVVSVTKSGVIDDSVAAQFCLNCYSVPANALRRPLVGREKTKVSIACWRVQPEEGLIFKDPETWVRATMPVLDTLGANDDSSYLRLNFKAPAHEKTENGIATSELAMIVKIETHQVSGDYSGSVYMLKIKPDSEFPVLPVQESPKDRVIWRKLAWPNVSLEAMV
ncbi:toxin VasX [Marinobacter sp. 1Y8]